MTDTELDTPSPAASAKPCRPRLAAGHRRILHRRLDRRGRHRDRGSSGWFDRGFVTYSNDAKTDMLGVCAR
jgi:hypothetical protein